MVIQAAQFSQLVDFNPLLYTVFFDEFKQHVSMIDQLYSVRPSNKASEHSIAVAGGSVMSEFNGTIVYRTLENEGQATFTHVQFAEGLTIERTLMEDDQYGVIAAGVQNMATVAARTMETHAALTFNNAFQADWDAGEFTKQMHSGRQAEALCADTHTDVADSSTTNKDNKETFTLSEGNLETMRAKMVDFRDRAGNRFLAQPDTLLVPPALTKTAFEIVASPGRSGTANNDANFFQGQLRVLTWNYLESSTAFFLIDSSAMRNFLPFFVRTPLEFKTDENFDSYRRKYASYMRYSFGFEDWRWCIGSDGTV